MARVGGHSRDSPITRGRPASAELARLSVQDALALIVGQPDDVYLDSEEGCFPIFPFFPPDTSTLTGAPGSAFSGNSRRSRRESSCRAMEPSWRRCAWRHSLVPTLVATLTRPWWSSKTSWSRCTPPGAAGVGRLRHPVLPRGARAWVTRAPLRKVWLTFARLT